MDSLSTGAEAGFFKVGRRGGRGWYLGVAESMEHAPKMRTGTQLKTLTPEVIAMPQNKNYNEVPVHPSSPLQVV